MVKNNIMKLVEATLKIFLLRIECFKLEIRIIWEGNTILKIYRNVDKLIEINNQKLHYYNDLLLEIRNINYEIEKDLNYTASTNSKLINQIRIHNEAKQIVDDKFRQLCSLNNKIHEIEEFLVNELSFVY